MSESPLAATLNGKPIETLTVWVTNVGPWQADVSMAKADAPVSGRVTIQIGTLKLSGTIAPEHSDTFSERAQLKVIAGAGGWRREVFPKSYHNDAGVKAQLVAEDAARECGEILGVFIPTAERLGKDYVREQAAASFALEFASGGAPWWVDFDGITHVMERPDVVLVQDAYHVSAYSPRDRTVTLSTPDPGLVPIGGVIASHVDRPGSIREMVITSDEYGLRIKAWLGAPDRGAIGRLAMLMQQIARRSQVPGLFGLYRYRVIRMSVDGKRVDLQIVNKATGLPDQQNVSVMPGIAGAAAALTPSTEVLVAFIDGDASQPIITHFAGVDGQSFAPVSLTLGGPTGAPAARQGDTVEVLLPPMVVLTGTIAGVGAFSGTGTFAASKTLGLITGGSTKVKVAP